MDAKTFAINAHKGQVRKVEPDKPLVIHPINVANILKEFDFNKEIIDAGYLHDVVEDTNYTLEDIKNFFGDKIYMLVKNVTDTDKALSWEERKQNKIEKVKTLDLESKALICADKISNIEDLINLSGKSKQYSFDKLKRGFEKQKWYYESIYESLIYNDGELPIFQRLKDLIDELFYTDFTKISDENQNKYKIQEIIKMASIIKEEIDFNNDTLDNLRKHYIEKLNELY